MQKNKLQKSWNYKIDLHRSQSKQHYRHPFEVQKSAAQILQHFANDHKCFLQKLKHTVLILTILCIFTTVQLCSPCLGFFRRLTLRALRSSCRRSWRANFLKSSVYTSSCHLVTRDSNPVLHVLTNPKSQVSVEIKYLPQQTLKLQTQHFGVLSCYWHVLFVAHSSKHFVSGMFFFTIFNINQKQHHLSVLSLQTI